MIGELPEETYQQRLERYDAWIWEQYGDNGGYGMCGERTEAMVAAFPELRRVRGMYHCPGWGRRTHWWCETAEGVIVDPSARQFPSQGQGRYEELEEADLPTGVCMDCGELVFHDNEFCNAECRRRTEEYLFRENQNRPQIPCNQSDLNVSE